MEYLEEKIMKRNISLYELKGGYARNIKRFIFSTPQTRAICNQPEVAGFRYTEMLKTAVTSVLKELKIGNLDEHSISVIHFLRGGINFGLREALAKSHNFNLHSSSFLTSQRAKDDYGRWYITEDQYRKIIVHQNSNLFLGDVIATGTTISNGLDVLYKLIKNSGKSVKNIFFFTIGCHKAEKILSKFAKKFESAFPDYENTYLFYAEGKFHLADSKTRVKIKEQGTDFLRYQAILAPEFERSQYEKISYPLERCTIYDAGSRSFDIQTYFEDVKNYWNAVKELGENGFTLYDALKERWPEKEYKNFNTLQKEKKKVWKGVRNDFLKELYAAYKRRWTETFTKESKSSRKLVSLCNKRIKKFKSIY